MKHYFSIILGAIMCLCLTACKDDEPRENFNWHPTLGAILSDSPNMVSITSEKGPQKGQQHRSSDNFSTAKLTGGDYLLWTCSDKNASFTVNIDVSGKDKTFASNLHDGAITSYRSEEKFYIADPKNASGSFTVTCSRIDKGEGYIYINAAKDHMEGQSHRASTNFDLGPYSRYYVDCPEEIEFQIMQDISAGTDELVCFAYGGKDIYVMSGYTENLYAADVVGASGPLTITLIPCEDDTHDWMSKISDNKRLCDISIPGTHDSGTGVVGAGMSKCQNFNFDRQLNDGIRFFDVRLNTDLHIAHGPTTTSQYLWDALSMFNKFLENHPKEVILMSVKSENGDASTAFFDYVNDHKNETTGGGTGRIVQNDTIPTLGEVRGKIVLFRRMPLASGFNRFGIDCYSYWPDDTWGEASIAGGYKLYVEDRYYSADEAIHDTEEKTNLVKNALKRACANKDEDKKTMFIIFNSVAGRVTHTPWDYAWGEKYAIDPIMNESLNANLDTVEKLYKKPLRAGAILMDFYNKHGVDDKLDLVSRIVNLNFK